MTESPMAIKTLDTNRDEIDLKRFLTFHAISPSVWYCLKGPYSLPHANLIIHAKQDTTLATLAGPGPVSLYEG